MPSPVPVAIGDTELARCLYAGRYADILAQTIDSRAVGCDAADVAFVVGALCFVGRLDEAELFLENGRRGSPVAVRTLAAGGFFLTVARARSGDFAGARRTLLRAFRETSRGRDAWSRAFLFQAVACCHYFEARYARAAQAALGAHGSALEARFAYLQMLATDMRAHVLAQRGDLDEGLRLLEQARDHARHLGFDVNMRVIEASIALERARVSHPIDAIAELEHLLEATDIQDGYSRRLMLSELAKCYALVGRGPEAIRAVDEAARLATRDPRARAALACARAEVTRVIGGWATAQPHLIEARRLVAHVVDPPLRAEIAGLELGCATFLGKAKRRAAALRELEALVAEHRLQRARSWLCQYTAASRAAVELDDLTRALRSVVATARIGVASRDATHAVLRTGLWGLLAEASGLAPGRRIHLFDDAEVLESDGDARRLGGLPPRGRAVLLAVARRPQSKEALLAVVWGLTDYRPERHDSLVKTTISRLRAALGRDNMWIETVEGGYRIAEGITVVAHGYQLVAEPSSLTEVETLGAQPRRAAADQARATRWARLARELGQAVDLSVGDLAGSVRASVRTISRDLSEMHRRGLVERIGEGRGTRYHARAPVEAIDEGGQTRQRARS
jgi:tetratricopeptide (TPR) repeat protein